MLTPLPQSDCVNTQVLVIKKSYIRSFMLQMKEINFTKMLQSVHQQISKQIKTNKKAKVDPKGDQHLRLL